MAVLFVAGDGALAEAEVKGGVGVDARPVEGEAGFADGGLGLLLDLVLGCGDFAGGAGLGVDGASELDHRVLGGGDGDGAIGIEILAEGDVADLRAVDKLGGAGAGGFAGEEHPRPRMTRDGKRSGGHRR